MGENTDVESAPSIIAPSEKELCSIPLRKFLRRHNTIFEFFFFIVELAGAFDKNILISKEALGKNKQEVENLREKVKSNSGPIFKKLASFSAFQSENICIRLTDNFVCFVSEIIQLCIRKKPELLRSSEMVRVEEVLRFRSHAALIEFLVERKINELTYGGIRELNNFLYDRTGLQIWSCDAERSLISASVELRNVYTHNRGVINDVFLRRMNNANIDMIFTRGSRHHLTLDDFVPLANNMITIARRLDKDACKKFKIRRKLLSLS